MKEIPYCRTLRSAQGHHQRCSDNVSIDVRRTVMTLRVKVWHFSRKN